MYNELLAVLLIISAMLLSAALQKLTVAGSIVGGCVAVGIYMGAGFTGIVMLGAFFVLGTATTSHQQKWKEAMGIATKKESKRTTGQVVANGGIAGLLGVLVLLFPQKAIELQTMLAASLAAATADTVSSELGVVYGRRFYNICTFKKDLRGRDGVVSWEGTLLGVGGSSMIALLYALGFGFTINAIWIVVAGTIGNIADSLLGATLERRGYLNNNAVNFCNTFIAALVALMAAS